MGVLDTRHLLNPKNFVSPDEHMRRWSICQSCPSLNLNLALGSRNDIKRRSCEHCKCIMYQKSKLKTEKGGICPIKKW